MPYIKKHFKIFIAILIVIILISSFIVYDITRNNVTYNNNGEPIDVKYFSVGYTFPYITNNYTASSYYVNHNKLSYMNSTIIQPRVLPYGYGCICFGINIHLKNVNNKYIYVDIISQAEPSTFNPSLNNATEIHSSYISGVCHVKYRINGNNISIPSITIRNIDKYIHNNYYNISVSISLNNNFYNTFDISGIKETAIYGSVGQSNTSQVRDPNLTSSLYIENNNTHNFHIVSIRDGYFYFFAQPDTTYKLYYMDNGKLHEFYHISNNKITGLNSITTSSAGNSTPLNIWK
ncbi:hypothetical protein FAD_1436 [Ferroplasma acidiphilum]|uniref:Uncharacterized protein n=1 Tax=Ferroplasma acidiphilum TaxID=74969 RepID=A0A1V0N5B6_9ARCH|nr:hypothetical protein [Ferroplasma acidiphilum]ARD85294.1 hypothetical protein FAD_1436 [Ferroplasma acidiphilum]WMT52400.1 MAG: hypothetical protein RE473_05140 [Ferroplasma acidiphilum]